MRATGRYLAVVLLLTILTPSLIAQDQPVTLFSSTATPASMNVSAGRPLDLGMKFKSDTAGYIAGVRFYKGASNVGTHIGSLWTETGDLLAQATFAGETASGWQQVNFAAPVAIAANVVYVVSYHSSGFYSFTSGFFNSPVANAPLRAVSGASGNGVYSYGAGSTFPVTPAAGANFWVDVVFTLTNAPPPPPPPPPPPAGDNHTLFDDSATPALPNASAGGPLEVGMKFSADVNGYVSGVRFYKGANNTGMHVGSLWSIDGKLLGQATFTEETASGWQQASFSPPVAINPNTLYMISYHSNGGFSYTLNYFNAPADNPPLHAPSTANGLYSFGANSVFPQVPVGAANFWVDVVFTTPSAGASLSSIAVTPANPSIAAGKTQQFTATGTYTDGTTHDLTASATWSSSNTGVAQINTLGLALAGGGGLSVITAKVGTVSGTTNLTVTGTPPPPPPSSESFTLLKSSALPAVVDANGGSPLEMGLRFTADRDGHVAGVRFYKGPSNTGEHVGSLWTDTRALLAQATFTAETASGWQEVKFATPVAIKANTVYVVSYHSSGHFSYDAGYFATPRDNPPLHPANGGNGASVFQYSPGSVFPQSGAAGANFWVDVLFTN